MRCLVAYTTLTLAAMLVAATVSAQPLPRSPARPPVEIGVGISGFKIFEIDFLEPEAFGPAADFRMTIPLTHRFSFESNVMIRRETNAFEQRTRALYSFLIRQRLRRASTGRTDVFLTYGGTGSIQHVSSDFFAGEPYTEVESPYAATIGIGVQRRLAQHLAVRADAQLLTILHLPLGVQVAGLVSIPFGSYP